MNIEEILESITALPSAVGQQREAQRLHGNRVYIALGPDGRPELFLRGSKSSFGTLLPSRVSEWGSFRTAPSNELLPALVIRTSATESGKRIMAHVAYEAVRVLDQEPSTPNDALARALAPFLRLVMHTLLLSEQEQVGLVGELQFLLELLESCSGLDNMAAALDSWKGPDMALRDFFRDGHAVEVKASSSGTQHDVGMEQLVSASTEERLFLCSVQVRRDSSAPVKLPHIVSRVEAALRDQDLIERFHDYLNRYGTSGYHQSQAGTYLLEPGFFVERATIRRIDSASGILRRSSFVDGGPPSSVSRIRYHLDASSIPLARRVERARLFQALTSG